MRIAILEDDTHIGHLMNLWLLAEGHTCDLFGRGSDFQRALSRDSYDLLVLDWILPDTSGDKVLVWVREHVDRKIPVIFVTTRDTEEDIVTGLSLGADDYMVKPIRHREFIARVSALGRRAYGDDSTKSILSFPPYEFNLDSRTVLLNGKAIELTQKEFELAVFLFRNEGRLFSRAHLLETIWAKQTDVATRTVDTHASRLRVRLGLNGEHGWRLASVYNHGYRLEPPTPADAT